MKILLIEAFHGGHHTNYIEAMLPAFRQSLMAGEASEVCITISEHHYNNLVMAGIVKQESLNIRYSPTFPVTSQNPSFRERFNLFNTFKRVIEESDADAVIVPSADYDVSVNALCSFGGKKPVYAVGVFHYGYPSSTKLTMKETVKRYVYELSWRNSNWNKLLFVNPVVYEGLARTNGSFSNKIQLLPDPVPPALEIDCEEARARLGIPSEGVYVGFVGMMDERKAIPQVLAVFSEKKMYEKCRLLLAGQLAKQYEELIHKRYQHLIDDQRIILINRHLSSVEVQQGYAAIDIVALLQIRRMNLSANLLKAVAYDKPVIADDCGYTGMMVRRFELGYLCDVDDHGSVTNAISRALEKAKSFEPSPQSQRLKEFHHPDNYAKTVMQSLNQNKNHTDKPLTWDWVCQNLDIK